MDKKQIASVFQEIGALLELKGENPFRVRAYQNAARMVDGLQEDLGTLIAEDRLTEVRGIGKDLAGKITELYRTGRLADFETLQASLPPGLLELVKIPGFGPKRAKVVYDELKIDSLAKLEAACREGRIAELKGFGERMQQKILEGIDIARRFSTRHLYSEALEVAEPILAELQGQKGVIRAAIAGSLRRRRETIGDIDFIISARPRDAAAIIGRFLALTDIVTVNAKGTTKASVVLRGGIQADLRVVTDDQYAFALNYFTGCKEHNIALRGRALQKLKLSLNEYGFSPPDSVDQSAKELGSSIACKTEEDLYRALELAYVPPELREDMGEIAAAERGELPEPFDARALRGTFHCHTTWSDGIESVEGMARAAMALGYKYLGIADHSQSEHVANGLPPERVRQQAKEIQALNRKLAKKGFRVFFGTECDILPDGSLDFDAETLGLFDHVIAAVHSNFGMDSGKMTARICKALEHPAVTMLAHPTGRLLLEREGYAVDMQAVIETAARHGKIIEINAHPLRLDMDWRLWKRAKELGVRCAINSDAHNANELGMLHYGVGVALKGWLEKKDVVNCLPLSRVEKALRR